MVRKALMARLGSFPFVMPALVAGIHVLGAMKKDVDGRATPGHDRRRADTPRLVRRGGKPISAMRAKAFGYGSRPCACSGQRYALPGTRSAGMTKRGRQ